MKRASLLPVILLSVLVARSRMAGAQPAGLVGAIKGHVINETEGGTLPQGLEIVLRGFRTEGQIEDFVSTIDSEGQFVFGSLQAGGDWHYLVQVSYEGVVYSRGPLSFQPGDLEILVEMPVYEVTSDDEDIRVERAHVLVEPSEVQSGQSTGLQVTEVHVFLNPGDQTYVGSEETLEERVVTRFFMPELSRDFAFEDGSLGGRFVAMSSGFGDREPLWPGTTSVVFGYTVDPGAAGYDLTRDIAHPIASLDVLVVDVGIVVRSERLLYAGQVNIDGQDHLHYVGQDLVPGERLDLVVGLAEAGLVQAASTENRPSAMPWIVLGRVLTAAALAYPFWAEHVRAAAAQQTHD
jgi:hypothetical protein